MKTSEGPIQQTCSGRCESNPLLVNKSSKVVPLDKDCKANKCNLVLEAHSVWSRMGVGLSEVEGEKAWSFRCSWGVGAMRVEIQTQFLVTVRVSERVRV